MRMSIVGCLLAAAALMGGCKRAAPSDLLLRVDSLEIQVMSLKDHLELLTTMRAQETNDMEDEFKIHDLRLHADLAEAQADFARENVKIGLHLHDIMGDLITNEVRLEALESHFPKRK